MGRVFCISLKRIIVLFVLVLVVVVGVFWSVERINTHKLWASMLRESQRLMVLKGLLIFYPPNFKRIWISQLKVGLMQNYVMQLLHC